MAEPTVSPEVVAWLEAGRTDVALWAEKGLGIKLHDKQVEFARTLLGRLYAYLVLWWANRAGKTLALCVVHMHHLFYKVGITQPLTQHEYEMWLKEEYRTLHIAPLNELSGRCFNEIGEIIKGTSKAQRDQETNQRRPAPLAQFFAAVKERDQAGADRMIVRCWSGGVMDFRSSEGKAARLEGGTWRLITWDEWPSQENVDDIRYVLDVRLTNRAADYDAPIVLTGTITPETEHIAKEFMHKAEDTEEVDWWGSGAARMMNPSMSKKAIERAGRNMDDEDYQRTILGLPGGVKNRVFPPFMLDRAFENELPKFTPPHPEDGVSAGASTAGDAARRARFRPIGNSPWTYIHMWDLALTAAENVGMVWRLPATWEFNLEHPIEGVQLKVIPGSRSLTSAEIVHTIEETYLPYGGHIVVDTTDAHGKNIARELRQAGYPAVDFDFHSRDERKVLNKDAAIKHLRDLLCEGMTQLKAPDGEPLLDEDGVPKFDRSKPYGVIRLPKAWTKVYDQLSVLRPDDERQRKDAAMAALEGGSIAYRKRRSRTRRLSTQPFSVFAGRRRYPVTTGR